MRMVTYLKAANKVIQSMDFVQSVTLLPSLLPKERILITDFEDYFFTISLQEKDREKIAFTVPTYNNSQPTKRYQWNLLPQGMSNSSTLCQYFVSQSLK